MVSRQLGVDKDGAKHRTIYLGCLAETTYRLFRDLGWVNRCPVLGEHSSGIIGGPENDQLFGELMDELTIEESVAISGEGALRPTRRTNNRGASVSCDLQPGPDVLERRRQLATSNV